MISVTTTQRATVDEEAFFVSLLGVYNPRQVLVLLMNSLQNSQRCYKEDRQKIAQFLNDKYHDDRHLLALEEEKNRETQ